MSHKSCIIIVSLLIMSVESFSQLLLPEKDIQKDNSKQKQKKEIQIDSEQDIPKDFPSNYVVDEWLPSSFKGNYVFYSNNCFLFIHGGINKSECYDVGTWEKSNNQILISLSKRFGLRPIGEPLNPEYMSAANPDDYLEYSLYQKYEEWINETLRIDIENFLFEECVINKNKLATDIQIDSSKYLLEGKFKVASCRLLSENDISNLNNEEIRLMRNEIFARYGYKFKSEDLKKYFNLQDWYVPKRDSVEEFLTEIEKSNIQFLKKYEL